MICGTRASPLAVAQTTLIMDLLEVDVELETIKTSGDLYRGQFGTKDATKDLFTKEIDAALASKNIDCAVHSLKDVKVDYEFHLVIPKRGAHNDVLVTRHASIDALPECAKIGTGSPRRATELRRLRDDLEIVPIRGNIGTRLDKVSDLDGVVVAEAGLRRLNLWGYGDYTYVKLQAPMFMPAACQGTLAIACRRNDVETRKVIERARDLPSTLCAEAEQEVMRAIGGNCHIPAGAYATMHDNEKIQIYAAINDPENGKSYRDFIDGNLHDRIGLARHLAKTLLEKGAKDVVRSFT